MCGEKLTNPITTERVEVLVSPEDSHGELLRIRLSIRPRSGIAAAHSHPNQAQTVAVEKGTLHCRVGGRVVVLKAGDSTTIPAGVSHDQWNEGDEEVVAIEETRPALRLLEVFRVVFALAGAGRTDSRGRPRLLLSSALLREYSDCTRAGSWFVQTVLLLLSPLSSLLGYRERIRALARRAGA